MWLLSRCATTASEMTSLPTLVDDRLLGDQDRDAGALRVVVLARDVQDVRADDVGHLGQDLGQALGVVGLVDVLDVAVALLFGVTA